MTRASFTRSRALLTFVALVVGLLLPAQPSAAHVWRTGLTGCDYNNSADSAAHGFWYVSNLSSAMTLATNYARSVSYDPTDINTFYVVSLAFDTDVIVEEWDVYDGWCGFNWDDPWDSGPERVATTPCYSLATNPANACEQFHIIYDHSWMSTIGTWYQIAIACHEIGHSLGLQHEPPPEPVSCMVDPAVASQNTISYNDSIWINLLY